MKKCSYQGADAGCNAPYLIGIAGPSCSGKSYLARHLADHLQATIFSLDSYYTDLASLTLAERARVNFDAPESIDSSLLIDHVRALSEGKSIHKPVYDFTIHGRTTMSEVVHPRNFLIIEGLFALYWQPIRELFNTTVFLQASDTLCLNRRQVRDVMERGRTPEFVQQQFNETVRPMAEIYVQPTQIFADVIINGEDDIIHKMSAVLRHVREQNLQDDNPSLAYF